MPGCSASRRSAGASCATLVGRVDLALGDSEFNRQELEALGFAPTGVLPIAVDTERITGAPRRPALEKILGDGLINFLFVGRIVPNKRIEDHIRLAELYKRYVDSYYRFIFVGRYDGVPALLRADPGADRRVPDAAGPLLVHRPGAGRGPRGVLPLGRRLRLAERARGLLRAAASRRWPPTCRSLAYAAGAVPETLGGAGVLFAPKDLEFAAELLGHARIRSAGPRRACIAGTAPPRSQRFRARTDQRQLMELVDAGWAGSRACIDAAGLEVC